MKSLITKVMINLNQKISIEKTHLLSLKVNTRIKIINQAIDLALKQWFIIIMT
jgi:hypothetical protein